MNCFGGPRSADEGVEDVTLIRSDNALLLKLALERTSCLRP
jgi:hypothetical protein